MRGCSVLGVLAGAQDDITATLLVWQRPTANPRAPPAAGHAQQECLLELPLCLPVAAVGSDPAAVATLVQLVQDSRHASPRVRFLAVSSGMHALMSRAAPSICVPPPSLQPGSLPECRADQRWHL